MSKNDKTGMKFIIVKNMNIDLLFGCFIVLLVIVLIVTSVQAMLREEDLASVYGPWSAVLAVFGLIAMLLCLEVGIAFLLVAAILIVVKMLLEIMDSIAKFDF